MYFIIGGVQPKTTAISKQAKACPACGRIKVYLSRVDYYLSLFFIPLFPVKKGTIVLICQNCKTVFDERGQSMEFDAGEGLEKCAHCGRGLGPDFSFCPYCGESVR